MTDYSEDYLLDKRIKILQPVHGYRASTDAVLLAAAVAKVRRGDSFLDIGSGTGAISLCLAERYKDKNITVKGLELQKELAELSNKSARLNGFEDFLSFEQTDVFQNRLPHCSFSHVISNPPYSDHDMPSPYTGKSTAHNFKNASLTDWIALMIKMIKPQGRFYMINRAEALEEILAVIHGKLGDIEVIPLYSKPGQNAKRVIIRARKDSKAPLIVHPGVIIHQESGEYGETARKILRDGEILA